MDDQAAQAPSRQLDPIAPQATPPITTTPPAEPHAPQQVLSQPVNPVAPFSPPTPVVSATPTEPAQLPGVPVAPAQPLRQTASDQPSLQPEPIQQSQLSQPPADISALTSIIPQAAHETAQQQLNPINAVSLGKKEITNSSVDSFSALAKEVPGAQSVEQERKPEISPELESWMESVERHDERPPEKVVIADKTAAHPTGSYASDPVIVLPLTQKKLQQGMKHNVQDSVKWLAVWCMRIIKKFHGVVVYRPVETSEPQK